MSNIYKITNIARNQVTTAWTATLQDAKRIAKNLSFDNQTATYIILAQNIVDIIYDEF